MYLYNAVHTGKHTVTHSCWKCVAGCKYFIVIFLCLQSRGGGWSGFKNIFDCGDLWTQSAAILTAAKGQQHFHRTGPNQIVQHTFVWHPFHHHLQKVTRFNKGADKEESLAKNCSSVELFIRFDAWTFFVKLQQQNEANDKMFSDWWITIS